MPARSPEFQTRPATPRHTRFSGRMARWPTLPRSPGDVRALPGDILSMANDINAQGQVVGLSCDANFNCRGFLWDKGVIWTSTASFHLALRCICTTPRASTIREGSRAPPLSKHRRGLFGFLGDSYASGANRWRFGPEGDPARKHLRVASATTAPWSPDDAAMTCKRGAEPRFARLRGRRLCAVGDSERRLGSFYGRHVEAVSTPLDCDQPGGSHDQNQSL
jgi:probable HAF family extracellular repeat protein